MKIVGVSAGVVGRDSNTDRIVKAIMEKSGYDSEFVKLTDLDYSACKGCVWLCAKQQVCKLEDDLFPCLQKIKEADAVILGSPVQFRTISATMSAFISRLWGFRHVDFVIQNKPFVLVVCGTGNRPDTAEEDFRRALGSFKVGILDVVKYSSKTPPCYRCGRHQECSIGGAYALWGEEVRNLKITRELFGEWERDTETAVKIEAVAEQLKNAVAVPSDG